MFFSQRKGLKPIKSILQVDGIDDDLRIGLWNVLLYYYFNPLRKSSYLSEGTVINSLAVSLWLSYFKFPLDFYNGDAQDVFEKFRQYFFNCEWFEVYDFIEAIVLYCEKDNTNSQFAISCNQVLEKELSAYRLVNGNFIKNTSDTEINEITEAYDKTIGLNNVNSHLKRALELLTDRKTPDYRNSIKESVSAVEAISVLINGKRSTLGAALKKLGDHVGIHSALIKAYEALYGYSNDSDGIRHALMDESSLSFDDAKFMLVSCSAFINYLIAKAHKAGLALE